MSELELKIEDGVAVITLQAVERRNALTPGLAREIIAALDTVDADDSVGAVVIQGGGGSFCSGAHLGTLAEADSDPAGEAAYAHVGVIYEAFVRVGKVRAPTIAAVRGAAVGAGLNLAMATDLRIVAKDAKLLSGFLRIGVHPGGGHFVLLSRLAGREAAAGMCIFSQSIDGDRAVRLGLAWEAVDDAEVEPRALELARIAAKDPALARATALSFRLETGPPSISWEAGVAAERAPQMWTFRRRSDASANGG